MKTPVVSLKQRLLLTRREVFLTLKELGAVKWDASYVKKHLQKADLSLKKAIGEFVSIDETDLKNIPARVRRVPRTRESEPPDSDSDPEIDDKEEDDRDSIDDGHEEETED